MFAGYAECNQRSESWNLDIEYVLKLDEEVNGRQMFFRAFWCFG